MSPFNDYFVVVVVVVVVGTMSERSTSAID
jgi:hypothetical protein